MNTPLQTPSVSQAQTLGGQPTPPNTPIPNQNANQGQGQGQVQCAQGSPVISQFLGQRNVLDAQKIAKNKQQLAITAQRQQQQAQSKKDKEQEEFFENVTDVAKGTEQVAASFNSNLTEIQVTRGLGVAFLLLVILLWALVPTKTGYTRLQLLWFTLLGETKLNHNAATNTIQSTLESQNNQTNQSQNPTVQLSGPSEEQVEAASYVHTTMQVLSDAEIAALNSSSF